VEFWEVEWVLLQKPCKRVKQLFPFYWILVASQLDSSVVMRNGVARVKNSHEVGVLSRRFPAAQCQADSI
jgi:hypothetical protein